MLWVFTATLWQYKSLANLHFTHKGCPKFLFITLNFILIILLFCFCNIFTVDITGSFLTINPGLLTCYHIHDVLLLSSHKYADFIYYIGLLCFIQSFTRTNTFLYHSDVCLHILWFITIFCIRIRNTVGDYEMLVRRQIFSKVIQLINNNKKHFSLNGCEVPYSSS